MQKNELDIFNILGVVRYRSGENKKKRPKNSEVY